MTAAAQLTLWPDLPDAMPQLPTPTRIQEMYARFGKHDGARCKTCRHFYAKRMSGTYFKCDLTVVTAGPGSDWRANWDACGKWEVEEA